MKRILLDTDPGIDDCLAIMLALNSKELDIVGITTVSGNVDSRQGAMNAARILEFYDRTDIPIFIGESKPLVIDLVTAQDTHGEDGMGEVFLPEPRIQCLDNGVDFILESLYKYPGELTIVAIGPLTNIAVALQRDRPAFDNLSELIVMGGSAKSHGNCSPVAEFNFWADPHGADYVFKCLNNITMVGLDVTREIVLTPNHRELLRQFATPAAQLVNRMTRFYVDFHWKQEKTLGCVINDPLAVAISFLPELVTTRAYYVQVETEGRSIGQSLVDFASFHRRKPNTNVCLAVDSERFMKLFLRRICPEFSDDVDLYYSQANTVNVRI
jgi:purine nucleosidase